MKIIGNKNPTRNTFVKSVLFQSIEVKWSSYFNPLEKRRVAGTANYPNVRLKVHRTDNRNSKVLRSISRSVFFDVKMIGNIERDSGNEERN